MARTSRVEQGSEGKELGMRFFGRFWKSRNAAPTVASGPRKGDQAAARRYWEGEVAADEAKRGQPKERP